MLFFASDKLKLIRVVSVARRRRSVFRSRVFVRARFAADFVLSIAAFRFPSFGHKFFPTIGEQSEVEQLSARCTNARDLKSNHLERAEAKGVPRAPIHR